MDEALRCDRLLLMRAGRIIADTTPDGLLADTGAADPDAAFLALVERDVRARTLAARAPMPSIRSPGASCAATGRTADR